MNSKDKTITWASLRADLAAMSDRDLRTVWERKFGPYVRRENSELVRDFVQTNDLDFARQMLNAGLQDKENAGAPIPSPSEIRRTHKLGHLTAPWKLVILLFTIPCGWFGLWLQQVTGSESPLVPLGGCFAALVIEFFAVLAVVLAIDAIKDRRRR